MRSDRTTWVAVIWLGIVPPGVRAAPPASPGTGAAPVEAAPVDDGTKSPAAGAAGSAAPATPYVPSEIIPPGTAVPFPVDI